MRLRHPHLDFGQLYERQVTDMIVIHHTGSVRDSDPTVEQIHYAHQSGNGWAGVGYHFVIRKDGTVEIGRPEWAIGSHAYGENSHTLGIHVCGDFEAAYPTQVQITTCAELISDLCRDYKIPCDRAHIVGHCDLMATNCPGSHLYSQLDKIITLANNFQLPTNDIQPAESVESIFDLVRRFETGDPASVNHGYGIYHLTGSAVKAFIHWLKNYPDDKLANYGRVLDKAKNFDGEWQMLGTVDPGHFAQLQDEFAKKFFFDEVNNLLAKENFHADKHSVALQAVIFARAVQYGVFGCIELLKRACPYPNLSYVDDVQFDKAFIADVYDYLISSPNYGRAVHTHNETLKKRFVSEKAVALA